MESGDEQLFNIKAISQTVERMESWISQQRKLLELESEAESVLLSDKISSLTGKQCETEGLSILNLDISSIRNELFGRCCLILEKVGKLPVHASFKVGDEVSLLSMVAKEEPKAVKKDKNGRENEEEKKELFGLVKLCNQQFIEVVVDNYDDYDDSTFLPPLRLNLRPSMKTHLKMMEALTSLSKTPHPLFSLLHRLGDKETSKTLENYLIKDDIKVQHWINNNLNESQREAVNVCINSNLVGVIHGPVSYLSLSFAISLL
jgi:hypothetical protein